LHYLLVCHKSSILLKIQKIRGAMYKKLFDGLRNLRISIFYFI